MTHKEMNEDAGEKSNVDERLAGLKLLKERLSDPLFISHALPNPIATNEAALKLFLEKTADLPMPAHHRLIALAEFLEEQLSWAQISDIYELMLSDENADRNAVYATWISLAEHILSKQNSNDALSGEVGQGLLAIFERALAETPGHSGFALGLGTAYLKNAERQSESGQNGEQTNSVANAITWLSRALEWTTAKNELNEVDKYIAGSCCLRLGQCYMALRVYKLALDHLIASSELEGFLGKSELVELQSSTTRCKLELAAMN